MDNLRDQTAIIVGGGIVGSSCALSLAARGASVTLVARDPYVQTASWGNAGHIAVEQTEPLASYDTLRSAWQRLFIRGGALSLPPGAARHWLPFAVRLMLASHPERFARGHDALKDVLARAVPAWRKFVTELSAPDLLLEGGHIVAWESASSAERGPAIWSAAQDGDVTCDIVDADELALIRNTVVPPISVAIRFTGTAQIASQQRLAEALTSTLSAANVKRETVTVQEIACDDRGAARVQLESGETLSADVIVVAAGAASGTLLQKLHSSIPLIYERGYHIEADADVWPQSLSPIVFEDRSLIVTRFDKRLRAASFVEFGGPTTRPDPRKWERLERHASELGLPFTGSASRWTGARPTLPDYLPAIGRSRRCSNLLYAFGHQHLGLTLAPLTGEIIAALASDTTPDVDLAPFDLDRFG